MMNDLLVRPEPSPLGTTCKHAKVLWRKPMIDFAADGTMIARQIGPCAYCDTMRVIDYPRGEERDLEAA
jgi:hypothetical protein